MSRGAYREVPSDDVAGERGTDESPSFWSRLTFRWALRGLSHAHQKRPLEQDDLGHAAGQSKARNVAEALRVTWHGDVRTALARGTLRPRFWWSVFKATDGVGLLVCLVLVLCARILQPVFLFAVLQVVPWEGGDRVAWLCCAGAGLWAAVSLEAVMWDYFTYSAKTISVSVRTAVTGLFYNKILLTKESDQDKLLSDNFTEKASRQLKQLDSFPALLPYLFLGPLEFVVFSTLLCVLVDWPAVTGLVYLFICALLRCGVGQVLQKLRGLTLLFTAQRLALVHDVIAGIASIKMNTWESLFIRFVSDVRRRELHVVSKKAWVLAAFLSVQEALPVVSLFISMVTLLLTNHTLTAEIAFTTFLILNILKTSCVQRLPRAVENVLHTLKTLSDIETFLLSAPEAEPSVTRRVPANAHANTHAPSMTVIEAGYLEHVTATRSGEELPPGYQESLKRADQPGVPDESPSTYAYIEEATAHAPPQASSGAPSRRRSLSVFDVSSEYTGVPLSGHFMGLTNVTLSCTEGETVAITGRTGAGKSALLAGIAGELPLSRGRVYVTGRIAYVTQTPWLFRGTLRENILFGEAFNQSRYANAVEACALARDFDGLPLADMTVVGAPDVKLSPGQQARLSLARALYSDAEIYLLDEPLALVESHIAEYVFTRCIMGEMSQRACVLVTRCRQHLVKMSRILLLVDGVLVKDCDYTALADSGEDLSWLRDEGGARAADSSPGETSKEEDPGDQTSVLVTRRTYGQYLAAGMHWAVLGLLGLPLLLLPEALLAWLVCWMAAMSSKWHSTWHQLSTVIMSSALIGAFLLASFLRALFFLALGLRSSKNLHNRAMSVVLRASVGSVGGKASSLFKTFSKDVEAVDEVIPPVFVQLMWSVTGSLLAASVPIAAAPVTALAVVPAAILLLFMVSRAYPVARELRRLETTAFRAVREHLVETCRGLASIRSYGKQEFAWNRLYRYLDQYNLVFLTRCAADQGTALRCQATVALLALVVIVVNLLTANEASLALSLVFARELAVGIALVPLAVSLLDNHMLSVAAILNLLQIPSEPGYSSPNVPPVDWPKSGRLEFNNVSFKYPGGGDAVLKNFSLNITSGMKIACIGRSGAGKSSLVAAMFRLAEPRGRIFIDGVPINELSLEAARGAMFVTTRNPFLFTASVRRNLDPHQRFVDMDLWGVLEVVKMKSAVENLPGQLNYVITNQSSSVFEAHERQLFGLARALLQDKRVIILEVVDVTEHFTTTRIVETLLKSRFQDRTVISVMHGNVGLDTILCQDKVAVLECGRLADWDSPQNLLCKEDSYLVSLWKHYRSAPPPKRKVRFGRASVSN